MRQAKINRNGHKDMARLFCTKKAAFYTARSVKDIKSTSLKKKSHLPCYPRFAPSDFHLISLMYLHRCIKPPLILRFDDEEFLKPNEGSMGISKTLFVMLNPSPDQNLAFRDLFLFENSTFTGIKL